MDILQPGTHLDNNLKWFIHILRTAEKERLAMLIKEHMPEELEKANTQAAEDIAARERQRERELSGLYAEE